MDWLILYDDGSEFSSEDGAEWQAPKSGVQMVFQFTDGAVSVERSDYGYWIWKDGQWFGTDVMGYWDYRFHHMEPQTVVYGRVLRNDVWKGEMAHKIQAVMGRLKHSWTKREYDHAS